MKVLILVLCCVAVFGRPQAATPISNFVAPPVGIIQFGIDAEGCLVGPSGKVCASGPVAFSKGATGIDPPHVPQPAVHHPQPAVHHNQNVFVGLVGPSGVIGPSGLVGPSGPLAFGK